MSTRGSARWSWCDSEGLAGLATLLGGEYHGANITFAAARLGYGVGSGDPLLGHGVELKGEVRRGERVLAFSAILDVPDPPTVVGAPLELVVTRDSRATLAIAFRPLDPVLGDTVFDGFDPFALAGEGAVSYAFAGAELNRLKRAFFTHDYFVASEGEVVP